MVRAAEAGEDARTSRSERAIDIKRAGARAYGAAPPTPMKVGLGRSEDSAGGLAARVLARGEAAWAFSGAGRLRGGEDGRRRGAVSDDCVSDDRVSDDPLGRGGAAR